MAFVVWDSGCCMKFKSEAATVLSECCVGCIVVPVLVFCKSAMRPVGRMQSLRGLLLVDSS